jgi:hypothetical protein
MQLDSRGVWIDPGPIRGSQCAGPKLVPATDSPQIERLPAPQQAAEEVPEPPAEAVDSRET